MDRSERLGLLVSGSLMAFFLAALVYAAVGMNITVPTCVTDVAPFREGKVIAKGDGRYEIHLVAKMWSFDPPSIELPVGAEADIYLSTLDVTHGMYIEGTDVNLMAVPGAVNAARVRFDESGELRVICNEYCGTAHHYMAGKFVIREPGEAVAAAAPVAAAEPPSQGGAGADLFAAKSCGACHSIDGTDGVGPTMKGLLGRQVELADGTTMKADTAYIEAAIRSPNATIVKGYQPVMPELPLSDDELKQLVDYVESLS